MDGLAPTAFFGKTYDETLALLREARDYAAFADPAERRAGDVAARLIGACESLRVTSRLSQIMAWLLARKAVFAGEISREQAAEEPFVLTGHTVCLAGGDDEGLLPPHLKSLAERSRALYIRVARLDEMVRRGAD